MSSDTDNSNDGTARLGKLSAALTHDFNNYVGAIQGYVELLRFEVEGQEEAEGFVDGILDSCSKITARTSMLENFAQNQRIAGSACDLNEVLEDLAAECEGLQCTPLGEAANVLGDPGLLMKVFRQLYLNAREASPDVPEIQLYLRREEEWIAAVMEDAGCGIDESWIGHVFDPYQTTKGKGRGFGLSWVYGWIGRMGGRIRIRNRAPGPGTEVTVWFAACDDNA